MSLQQLMVLYSRGEQNGKMAPSMVVSLRILLTGKMVHSIMENSLHILPYLMVIFQHLFNIHRLLKTFLLGKMVSLMEVNLELDLQVLTQLGLKVNLTVEFFKEDIGEMASLPRVSSSVVQHKVPILKIIMLLSIVLIHIIMDFGKMVLLVRTRISLLKMRSYLHK